MALTPTKKRCFLLTLFCAALLQAAAGAASQKEVVRLTIFHPSARRLHDVLGLLQIGWLKVDRLKILGVYQAKEKVDLPAVQHLIRAHPQTSITLRRISAEAGPEEFFKKNALTADIEDIFRRSDGIIFFGGPDIPPSFYGKPTRFLTLIEDPYRHALEIAAVFRLLGGSRGEAEKPLLDDRPDFPILGICLGGQTLNVGTGGTLTQDIWTETYGLRSVEEALKMPPERWHTNPFLYLYPTDGLFEYNLHPIRFEKKGRLAAELGLGKDDRPYVLSAHHQQIDRLGGGLRPEAFSADGRLVEALSHERYPSVLGLLFHPEEQALRQPEALFKLGPGKDPGQNLRAFLQNHPPSLEFHQKLWAWFSQRLEASAHSSRQSR
jgi:putative glutamine amidotransferase